MPLAQHLNRLLDLLTEEVIRDKPASLPLRRSTTDPGRQEQPASGGASASMAELVAFVVVPAPDRQRIACQDVFQAPRRGAWRETTLWAVALEVGGKLNAVVLALRGRRQDDELGVGEFHGDLQ